MKPIFFASPAELRRWFAAHHKTATELWVGYYKASSGKRNLTWPLAVDEALCVGWIDSVAKPIDEHRYMQRFTPRRPGSNWSNVNIAKVRKLIAAKRMRAAGLRAFEARTKARSGVYSFEQNDHALPPAMEKQLRANRAAWTFFSAQAPSYQRIAIHLVMSAKQQATRERRLATLIADSAAGLCIKQLRRPERARQKPSKRPI